MESSPHQPQPVDTVADAVRGSWVYRLPRKVWPFAQLARWERPIGWRLLMWPCWWSVMLAVAAMPHVFRPDWGWIAWTLALFTLGAFVMRGAGCTWNDLADQDIDARVARTRSRPLPSGRVSRRAAWAFLLLQGLVGLNVLLSFNATTIALGFASLGTVAIYPFMKRITWWPQLFLGFAFSWGALMGWPAVLGVLSWPPLALYAGSIAWVIGYDTLYALQDIEDDALVGVKSTARLFGRHARAAIGGFYALAIVMWGLAFALADLAWPAYAGLGLAAVHMIWQLARLDRSDPALGLRLFRSNFALGWLLFAGLLSAALTP